MSNIVGAIVANSYYQNYQNNIYHANHNHKTQDEILNCTLLNNDIESQIELTEQNIDKLTQELSSIDANDPLRKMYENTIYAQKNILEATKNISTKLGNIALPNKDQAPKLNTKM